MNILEVSRNGSSGLGGMVSRALTANDPLNDQREREREREGFRETASRNGLKDLQ